MKKFVANKPLRGKTTLTTLGLTSMLLLTNCNTVESKGNTTQSTESPTPENKNAEPDLQMTAKDLANQTLKNENFAWDRIGKRIELKDVYIGGTENLSRTQVNLWGNDGDVHYNGKFMCCRYIFKITDPEVIQAAQNSDGEFATITGTLTEYRDNQSTTQLSSQPIIVKEFVFDNIKFEHTNVDANSKNGAQESNQSSELVIPEDVILDTSDIDQYFKKVNVDKAYFYNDPDGLSRQDDYLVKGSLINWRVQRGDFYYIEHGDPAGSLQRGWIRKADVISQK